MSPDDLADLWRTDGVEYLDGRARAARKAATAKDGAQLESWHADLCRRSATAWEAARDAYAKAWENR